MKALIFDCDGVILESEELHRKAYNKAWENFDLIIDGKPVEWSEDFYDMIQNKVGGGKPKMRWFFGQVGWPASNLFNNQVPASEEEQNHLIDTLQAWKTKTYIELIGSGEVDARPGVLRLMDEAYAAGLKVAVCSAATKDSVVFTLDALLGPDRVKALDCFLGGNDVARLKPDPLIYVTAAEKMGVSPDSCVVIEDSMVGLAAARGAGMRCVITYTNSTKTQAFGGAERIVTCLGFPANVTVAELMEGRTVQDDRVNLDEVAPFI
eukprot:CAMPEP_0119103076 /NCGR_PEP_ID=MMETSP1180-20130426/1620_1 /TAXON_ID=3052 ORGANISM="Chlamydomonas cf sp, Strain CCMP681" /NCGR_SAMPLE_ID=MMETSP1180 /ASSEMBLY_ACC=CAM_ASM_000741 /LENGTH=264 /DNA_ID=CAMNT_0007087505 /DNA_START=156 /DNA_END=950 /DNA_ORIENTATION=+